LTPRVPATSMRVTLISIFRTYRSFRVLSIKCEQIIFLKLEVTCVVCGLTNCTVGPKPTKGLKSEGLGERPKTSRQVCDLRAVRIQISQRDIQHTATTHRILGILSIIVMEFLMLTSRTITRHQGINIIANEVITVTKGCHREVFVHR